MILVDDFRQLWQDLTDLPKYMDGMIPTEAFPAIAPKPEPGFEYPFVSEEDTERYTSLTLSMSRADAIRVVQMSYAAIEPPPYWCSQVLAALLPEGESFSFQVEPGRIRFIHCADIFEWYVWETNEFLVPYCRATKTDNFFNCLVRQFV